MSGQTVRDLNENEPGVTSNFSVFLTRNSLNTHLNADYPHSFSSVGISGRAFLSLAAFQTRSPLCQLQPQYLARTLNTDTNVVLYILRVLNSLACPKRLKQKCYFWHASTVLSAADSLSHANSCVKHSIPRRADYGSTLPDRDTPISRSKPICPHQQYH